LKFLQDKHEELQFRQAEMEERRKVESDLKRRLERELDDLERELRGTREEMDLQIIASKKEKREIQSSFQLTLDAKQKVCNTGCCFCTNTHTHAQVDHYVL
jgi:hypothetical protein